MPGADPRSDDTVAAAAYDRFALLELVVPGLGHLFRGRYQSGLAWLAGAGFVFALVVSNCFQLFGYGLKSRLAALEDWSWFVLVVLPFGQTILLVLAAGASIGLPLVCAGLHPGVAAAKAHSSRQPWGTAPWGLPWSVLLVIATLVASALLAPMLGLIILALTHLVAVSVAWCTVIRGRPAFGAAVAIWVAGWCGAFQSAEVQSLVVPDHSVSISVSEAPTHARRQVLVLGDARFGCGVAGGYARHFTPETVDYYETLIGYHLLPLVPPGWTESDPVPAWALHVSKGRGIASLTALRDQWHGRPKQGFVLRPLDAMEIGEALENAEDKGLRGAPDAPIIRLSSDAAADLALRSVCVMVFALTLVLVLALEASLYRRWIGKPSAAVVDDAAA
ncbi:MAG: hypothetical protein CMJ83_20905 [Planctomycetes bacterium]|nr:hypothetical protein [Planctomycetota bacterium]